MADNLSVHYKIQNNITKDLKMEAWIITIKKQLEWTWNKS